MSMSVREVERVIGLATRGIGAYLQEARDAGVIDQQQYDEAARNTVPSLTKWLEDADVDRVSPLLKNGIADSVKKGRWEDIVNAFRRSTRFGTGGIRTMMAFDRASIVRLKEEGIGARILKGPNTINDLVLLLTSAGVARFGKAQTPTPFSKVVIGYDSRVRGYDFAAAIAQLFLASDYTVYFFDEACPYPEVTFAIPHASIKADLGVFISASHNDYRYNGYKLSCANGSQFDPQKRGEMYNDFIAKAKPADIRFLSFRDAPRDRLIFLGGEAPLEGFDYAGRSGSIINIHEKHRDHVKSFLLTPDLAARQQKAKALRIAYCAFHGAGRRAVPRLLKDVGFGHVQVITGNGLNDLDGLFPSFCSEPGREQQPDPGDPRAAAVAVKAYKKQYPGDFGALDILIGTDPDADRCGVVVKVPKKQRRLYGNRDYCLLPADELWTLVLWHRMQREVEQFGRVQDAEKKFVVLSHTTSDSITRLCARHGLGVIKSWVGFPTMAAATQEVWEQGDLKELASLVDGRNARYRDLCHPFICECLGIDNGKRSVNVAALEQSNGFSILGGRPADPNSLGVRGHVRDKDGTFAGLLVAEAAAWAKDHGMTLIEVLDRHVYLDPEVGLFVGAYEPDPLDGEYPGIEGDRIKMAILRRAFAYYHLALAGDLKVGGRPVHSATVYRTGKYDAIYPPTPDFSFPDEGIRFFFDKEKLNHFTIRPSGTGNSLRFHVQLHTFASKGNLLAKKAQLHHDAARIMADIRKLMKAPYRR